MKANLKIAIYPVAATSLLVCAAFSGNPKEPNLDLINRLSKCVEERFANPAPQSLGMSRVAFPNSFGAHFRPDFTLRRDFEPQNGVEREVVAGLEREGIQAGLYVFGLAVATSDGGRLDFRALKGPAAVTSGTPRPSWYPPQTKPDHATQGALPDWEAVFPLARRAMRSFQDGGKGFESKLDSWDIAVRPLIATQERCVACHNSPAYTRVAALGQPLGGVIYAFRQARN